MTDKCINPSQSRPYLSIRDACNATGLSQYYLRSGCKQGTVPHIMVGSKSAFIVEAVSTVKAILNSVLKMIPPN